MMMRAVWNGVVLAESDATNADAAWFYRHPLPPARKIKDRVTLDKSIEIVASGPQASG